MWGLCDEGKPQDRTGSQLGRRDFLKTPAATGAAAGLGLFATRPVAAHDDDAPEDSGRRGRRYIIRSGALMSMDPNVSDFPKADVLVEGKKILAVGPNLHARDAGGIDRLRQAAIGCWPDHRRRRQATSTLATLHDGTALVI